MKASEGLLSVRRSHARHLESQMFWQIHLVILYIVHFRANIRGKYSFLSERIHYGMCALQAGSESFKFHRILTNSVTQRLCFYTTKHSGDDGFGFPNVSMRIPPIIAFPLGCSVCLSVLGFFLLVYWIFPCVHL